MTAAGIQKQTLTDAVSHAILEEPQHLNWDNFLGVLLKVQRTANTFEIPENVSSCPCHGAWRVRLTYPRVFIFFSELYAASSPRHPIHVTCDMASKQASSTRTYRVPLAMSSRDARDLASISLKSAVFHINRMFVP